MIATYSKSQTVANFLARVSTVKGIHRVIASESRPVYDGRIIARDLAETGIDVIFTVDMGLFAGLDRAEKCIVGADAVFPDGLINKPGARPLVEMARNRNMPIYSLCDSSKFLPVEAYQHFQIQEKPIEEVWPDPPRQVHVSNAYFEKIPLDEFSGIIRERGIHSPEETRNRIAQFESDSTMNG